jgi:hypothetical protein
MQINGIPTVLDMSAVSEKLESLKRMAAINMSQSRDNGALSREGRSGELV